MLILISNCCTINTSNYGSYTAPFCRRRAHDLPHKVSRRGFGLTGEGHLIPQLNSEFVFALITSICSRFRISNSLNSTSRAISKLWLKKFNASLSRYIF